MTKKKPYRLGLDVGTNSLGWCVLGLDNKEKEPNLIIAAGVRIFSDGREDKTTSTLAAKRREARLARRRRDRFKQRQIFLLDELTKAGLFPTETNQQKNLQKENPLELRATALSKKLSPNQVGRALFHLNQRRGFKSNRKDQDKENRNISSAVISMLKDMGLKSLQNDDESTKTLLKDVIADLKQDKSLSYGCYLWQRIKSGKTTRKIPDEEGLYPFRDLYEDEFEKIWQTQAKHHPKLMTDAVKERISTAIFTQRPLKPQTIGSCAYMLGKQRAYKAMPSLQQYRIYQEVNNLEWTTSKGTRKLIKYKEARNKVVDLLNQAKAKVIKFERIKKLLKQLGVIEEHDIKFNLEANERKALDTNHTARLMREESRLGKLWDEWSLKKRDEFIACIIDSVKDKTGKLVFKTDDEVSELLVEKFQLTPEQAINCVNAPFDDGTASLSVEAANLLLVKMKDRYIIQSKAVKEVADENSEFVNPSVSKGKRDLLDKLPYYGEAFQDGRHIIPADREDEYKGNDFLYFGGITNPTVHIALNQIRCVTNEIIKRFGLPNSIAIELGRELPLGVEGLREQKTKQNENKKRNEKLNKTLEEANIRQNGENRLKLSLWEEQEHRCIFTGDKICFTDLFSAQVEIEHLLPYSKTLDDGRGNKVVCFDRANKYKNNRTPFEAFGHSPKNYSWEEIFSRATKLHESKHWRFTSDAMEKWKKNGELSEHYLNDTRYIGRLAKDYLEYICPREKIHVVTGKLTAVLRHHWGLNSVLSKEKPARKNRNDHRHHAIDAVVVGRTSRSLIQKISTFANKFSNQRELLDVLYDKTSKKHLTNSNWKESDFREEVIDVIDPMIVSHKRKNKKLHFSNEGQLIATIGQLHNETAYGIVNADEGIIVGRKPIQVVSRKPVQELTTPKKLKKIRDKTLKQIFIDDFNAKGTEGVLALAEQKKIRSLRCLEKKTIIPITDKQGQIYKGFEPGSNWAMEIYEYPEDHPSKGKWEGFVISQFDAHRYGFKKGFTSRPYPTAKLVMRLQINDYVRLVNFDDEYRLNIFRVQKLSNNLVVLAPPNEANVAARDDNKADSFKFVRKTVSKLQALKAKKVHVSPTGLCSIPNL